MKNIIIVVICLWSLVALAHKPSDSYLSIEILNEQLSGRWDIAIRDLDFALALDSNDDGAITWLELRTKTEEINHYVFSRLLFNVSNTLCVNYQTDLQVDEHSDGKYAVLFFNTDCGSAAIDQLKIDYRLFADIDPQHRGLLNLTHDATSSAAVLVPGDPARIFRLSKTQGKWQAVRDFIREGIGHIAMGYDHLLFLISLIIPSVMVYESARWQPARQFNHALWDVFKVVTCFTLAHSITLSLSALGFIELPSRWVETSIAASVILAAINNLVPIFTKQRALLAFTFGLIHGFGFASVLNDLGLKESSKLWSLLGFNLGVEIGQFCLVMVFLPIAYKLSRYPLYQPVVLKLCSIIIASLAMFWLMERAFNLTIMV